MQENKVFVKILDPRAKIPKRATDGSVGYDLFSIEEKTINPWSRDIIRTGLSMEIQTHTPDIFARILPRSSLSIKNGIIVGAGVIDTDYRGEIKVVLFNMNDEPFHVTTQNPIAQIVFQKFSTPEICIANELSETKRGSGGFGSTDRGFGSTDTKN
jgi:dUTP pyrophosphatase